VVRRAGVLEEGHWLTQWTNHLPGEHNALNAAAAAIIANWLGADWDQIALALADFRGVDRRMQRLGTRRVSGGEVTIYDDYGHHPTEIEATLAAAKGLGGRVLVVFQPHRYSRTAALREEFGGCFGDADRVWMLDVYAAGESPIAGATAQSLVESAHARGARHVEHAPDPSAAAAAVAAEARPGDTVITLGAGDVWKLGEEVLSQLRRMSVTPEGARR